MERIQKTTIKALMIKDGKALFVKDNGGLWELPGGTMEYGEQPEDTLRRELREELGVEEINIEHIVSTGSFVIRKPEWGKEYQFTAIIFAANFDISQAKLSDEHVEMKCFDTADLSNLNTREVYREAAIKLLTSNK